MEEAGKVFQVLLLVPFEVAAHNDNAPGGDTANAATVFHETGVYNLYDMQQWHLWQGKGQNKPFK